MNLSNTRVWTLDAPDFNSCTNCTLHVAALLYTAIGHIYKHFIGFDSADRGCFAVQCTTLLHTEHMNILPRAPHTLHISPHYKLCRQDMVFSFIRTNILHSSRSANWKKSGYAYIVWHHIMPIVRPHNAKCAAAQCQMCCTIGIVRIIGIVWLA